MKIKVSKVFADYINKTAKELGFRVYATFGRFTEPMYRNIVGSLADALDYGDYDTQTGEYKTIRLEYPAHYYAPTKFLTTKILATEFRRLGITDEAGLKEMVRNLCEV